MTSDGLDTSVFSDDAKEGMAITPEAKPWARFWARRLDVAIWVYPVGFVVGLILGLTAPQVFETPLLAGPLSGVLFGLVTIPFAFLVDAVVVSIFGNSLGKWIVGIRVERADGGRLRLSEAVRRNFLVYVWGFGLAIPLLNLIAFVVSYNKINEGGRTSWDKGMGTRVVEHGASLGRTTVAAVLVVVLTLVDRLLAGV